MFKLSDSFYYILIVGLVLSLQLLPVSLFDILRYDVGLISQGYFWVFLTSHLIHVDWGHLEVPRYTGQIYSNIEKFN